jgi:hypothetical protein
MKVVDIKKQLHAQIDMIDDEAFLAELENLIQSQLGLASPYTFSPAQLESIVESRKQLAQGLGIPHDQVMEESERWLDEV